MNLSVYLRPLRIEDAQISYQWRNNPKIWRFTGKQPDRYITPEIETEWLKKVLERKNEIRFAICLCSNDKYIGNIFFTDVTNTEAQLHIFIGDIEHWGGGRVYDASRLIIEYAFKEMKIDCIYNVIKRANMATLIAAKRLGFEFAEDLGNDLLKHIFTREMFEKKAHLTYVHKTVLVNQSQ